MENIETGEYRALILADETSKCRPALVWVDGIMATALPPLRASFHTLIPGHEAATPGHGREGDVGKQDYARRIQIQCGLTKYLPNFGVHLVNINFPIPCRTSLMVHRLWIAISCSSDKTECFL